MTDLIRILYVDDSHFDRALVRCALQAEVGRFELTEAGTRAEFEQQLASGRFDAVLSDFNILGYEGLQVLERVRADFPDLPVIIVTGTGSEQSGVDAMKQGAADYVIKTARHIQRLPHTIDAVLEARRQRRERERAEAARQETESTYRKLVDAASEGILVVDTEGRLLEVNPAVCLMLGYTRAELLAKHGRDIVADTEVDRVEPELVRIQSGEVSRSEWTLLRKDGSLFPVEASATLLPDGRLLGILHDVTERRHAEEAMRASEERFRRLIENASDLITVVDAEGLIGYQSPSVSRVLGYSTEELIGKSAFAFIHPEDVERARESLVWAMTNPNPPALIEYRFRHHDGSWRTLESIGRSLGNGSAGGSIIINSRDVTESRKLAEQLRQSQKMEAVGQLAGGVAHDFNNILAVILMSSDLIGSTPGLDPEVATGIQEIKEAGERAADLTRQLLLFSRRQRLQRRPLDLNDVVASISKMLHRVVGADVQMQLIYAPTPVPVHADAGMLEQVLVNLAVNSRDAMPDGGRLVIETRAITLDMLQVSQVPGGRVGDFACVTVSDTGRGIPPDVLPHIFEPFFTTKDVGKGTGLGLATVFGIVQQHDGWIKVCSEPGKGTTFRIYLPRVTGGEVVARSTAVGIDALPKGMETVLIVEDEIRLRALIRHMLNRLGYRVLEAATAAAALDLWGGRGEEIDLLLTDIVMPGGMSGRELAERLHVMSPGLRVIYTSGYSVEIAGGGLDLEEGVNYLAKPYSAPALAETVRTMLDRQSA